MRPLLVVLGCLVGGCQPADAPTDTTLVISSDPELRAMAAELLPELAERSGLELVEPVRVERRGRDELESFLRAKLDEELSSEEEEHLTRAYHLLGLVPEDLALRDILLSVYTEQVAGFYDPDAATLFVLDDQPAEAMRTLLIHELVHAVQDQAVDLDSITHKSRGNDRQIAAQAAIEGHATLVMMEYIMGELQGQEVDFAELDDFGQQIRPALEAVRAQYPALFSAPRIIQESLLFPYIEGAGFVQALWRSGDGRPAPFGRFLPQSTEQIFQPSKVTDQPDPPTDLALSASDAEVLFEDQLGAFETRVFLEELADRSSGAAADGWDGDRYALLRGADGSSGLVWMTVWDGLMERDRFASLVESRLGTLPGPASVERTDLDGSPALLLRVSWPGPVTFTRVGG